MIKVSQVPSKVLKKSRIMKLKELALKRNKVQQELRDPNLTIEKKRVLLKRKFSIDDKMTPKNPLVSKLKTDLKRMIELKD